MENSDARQMAADFAAARRKRVSLAAFPGTLPTTREQAYAIQDEQIALSGTPVVGWKVALTPAPFLTRFGEDRLAGPVFQSRLKHAPSSAPVEVDLFEGGFAAVEAEFIAVLGEDAPVFGRLPTIAETLELVSALHVGVEMAGSPLATINDLGPMAVASDCGNNDGAILGPAIQGWRDVSLDAMTASVFIGSQRVGSGSAANVKGGPMAAVAFLIWHLERRGRGLRAGDIISTGATTGIHMIKRGQRAHVDFGSDGQINVHAT